MQNLTFIKSDFVNLEGNIRKSSKDEKTKPDIELGFQFVDVTDCPVVRAIRRRGGGDPEDCPLYYDTVKLNKVIYILRVEDSVTVSWDEEGKNIRFEYHTEVRE